MKTASKDGPVNPFIEKLGAKIAAGKRLCVGLDLSEDKLPENVSLEEFAEGLVKATIETAAVFKPNWAFYLERTNRGIVELARLMRLIVDLDPGMPIIVDTKSCDIGATNVAYTKAVFGALRADATTINPYLGWDQGMDVFLGDSERFCFILCRTSNPGARDLQDLPCELRDFIPPGYDEPIVGSRDLAPLYQVVAYKATHEWSVNNNCGLVVGATYPDELTKVRNIAPNLPLLIPGVGKQGGSLELSVAAAHNPDVPADFVINVSSAISEAWKSEQFRADPKDFATAARRAAESYTDQIRKAVREAELDQ